MGVRPMEMDPTRWIEVEEEEEEEGTMMMIKMIYEAIFRGTRHNDVTYYFNIIDLLLLLL